MKHHFRFQVLDCSFIPMMIFPLPWVPRILRGPSENLLGQTVVEINNTVSLSSVRNRISYSIHIEQILGHAYSSVVFFGIPVLQLSLFGVPTLQLSLLGVPIIYFSILGHLLCSCLFWDTHSLVVSLKGHQSFKQILV